MPADAIKPKGTYCRACKNADVLIRQYRTRMGEEILDEVLRPIGYVKQFTHTQSEGAVASCMPTV